MKDLNEELDGFIGSQECQRHFTGKVYTTGVQYLAEEYNCYGLIDHILIEQLKDHLKDEHYQIWIMKGENCKGELQCFDLDGKVLYTHKFTNTTFDGKVKLRFQHGTLYLPSED